MTGVFVLSFVFILSSKQKTKGVKNEGKQSKK